MLQFTSVTLILHGSEAPIDIEAMRIDVEQEPAKPLRPVRCERAEITVEIKIPRNSYALALPPTDPLNN